MDYHYPNLASKVLSLYRQRIQKDWQYIGDNQGYQRTRTGYSDTKVSPKRVFVLPLQRTARKQLAHSHLPPLYQSGLPKMKLSADQMRSLPAFFQQITDPRRAQGLRHPIGSVLAIAAAAVLCGMRGYKAIADWTQALSPHARTRFRCCYRKGLYIVPSESILRDILIRVDPVELDQALQQWNTRYGSLDESLAIDGKTTYYALNDSGQQTHIMSVIGHQTQQCYTQKKSVRYR